MRVPSSFHTFKIAYRNNGGTLIVNSGVIMSNKSFEGELFRIASGISKSKAGFSGSFPEK